MKQYNQRGLKYNQRGMTHSPRLSNHTERMVLPPPSLITPLPSLPEGEEQVLSNFCQQLEARRIPKTLKMQFPSYNGAVLSRTFDAANRYYGDPPNAPKEVLVTYIIQLNAKQGSCKGEISLKSVLDPVRLEYPSTIWTSVRRSKWQHGVNCPLHEGTEGRDFGYLADDSSGWIERFKKSIDDEKATKEPPPRKIAPIGSAPRTPSINDDLDEFSESQREKIRNRNLGISYD